MANTHPQSQMEKRLPSDNGAPWRLGLWLSERPWAPEEWLAQRIHLSDEKDSAFP